MQGLGVFSCETKNWLGFNNYLEALVVKKDTFTKNLDRTAAKAMCVPKFKWLHRFGRPDGVKYPLVLEDRIWNYFVGWLELTKIPNDPMILDIYVNFSTRIPQKS